MLFQYLFLYLGMYAVLPGGNNLTKGSLTSPLMPAHPTIQKCLMFYYQMSGKHMRGDALSVYLKDVNGKITNIFEIGGDQGNSWIRKAYTIVPQNYTYNVMKSFRSRQ